MTLASNRASRRLSGKILYIANVDWYFSLHWLNRALAAKDAGLEVHVAACCTDKSIFEQWNKVAGFIPHHIPFDKISTNLIKETVCFNKLKGLIRTLRPDIVHCVTVKPNLYGGLLTVLYKIPSIKSVTGLGAVFSNNKFSFQILRRLILMAYRLIDRFGYGLFIFENDEDLKMFRNRSIISKQSAVLIRGAGVCLQTYRFCPPPSNSDTVILFAGRLIKEKGLELLIKAVNKARRQGESLILQVAGIIDKQAINAIPLQKIEEWHRFGLIDWLGERKDIPTLIATADIVALPTSYAEGVPRILLEAAAVGRPLIACDVAGCRDIVIDGQTGRLVPPGDLETLTTAILDLTRHPDRRNQMGKTGAALVAKYFDDTMVIEKTLSVYTRILGRTTQ